MSKNELVETRFSRKITGSLSSDDRKRPGVTRSPWKWVRPRPTDSRVGSLTANWERFFEWKRIEREDDPRRGRIEPRAAPGRLYVATAGASSASTSVVSSSSSSEPTAPRSFLDVPSTADYLPALIWARAANIVSGYDDGTFKPVAELQARFIYVDGFGGMDAVPITSNLMTPWSLAGKSVNVLQVALIVRVSGS